MSILFTILISLFLGYSMGVQHERKKYICLEEPDENGEEVVIERPKESFRNKIKKSVKKNLF